MVGMNMMVRGRWGLAAFVAAFLAGWGLAAGWSAVDLAGLVPPARVALSWMGYGVCGAIVGGYALAGLYHLAGRRYALAFFCLTFTAAGAANVWGVRHFVLRLSECAGCVPRPAQGFMNHSA